MTGCGYVPIPDFLHQSPAEWVFWAQKKGPNSRWAL